MFSFEVLISISTSHQEPLPFCPFQGRRPVVGKDRRFSVVSIKNIKIAVLLAAGPVSTHLTVKNMSTAFNMGVSKAKFLSAAQQLEKANLGRVVILDKISRSAHVFVKKPPAEAQAILVLPDNDDLCTSEEYAKRYNASMPSTITTKMRECLQELRLLPHQMAGPSGDEKGSDLFPYAQMTPASMYHQYHTQ